MSATYGYPLGRSRAVRGTVTVYGTSWCAATHMIRRYLARLGVPHRYVDLEDQPEAAARVAWVAGGRVRHPVVTAGGYVLVEPSLAEVAALLSRMAA